MILSLPSLKEGDDYTITCQCFMFSVQTEMASLTVVPDTIAHYEVFSSSKLGQGAYGTVYLGRDTSNNQQVAIKSIEPPVPQRGTNIMRRIQTEVKLLRLVNHPNIVRLLHYDQKDRCAYMVLELCTSDLRKFASEHHLPEGLKLDFIHDLLQAVRHLHNTDIIHRDIKPENALIKEDGDKCTLKITDFGLSRLLPEGSSSKFTATSGIGTYHWMAPEIFPWPDDTRTRYSKPADVFSAGLLTGSIVDHTTPDILTPRTGILSSLLYVISTILHRL